MVTQRRQTVALVLGSGAARGIAHIGVLKVLEQNRIPIDMVVGCSIGAVIGAHYVLNTDVERLEQTFLKMSYTDFLKLIDLSRPNKPLIKGQRLREFFDELYEGKIFSDTKLPFAAVATDFQTGKGVVLNEGSIAEAVRASISIPGIFMPVRVGDRTLVDGGLIMPTPIEIAKTMGADTVIAVDLPILKGADLEKLNLVESILHSYEIMRERFVTKGPHTVIIRPNFKNSYVGLRFNDKKLVTVGEAAAKDALPDIKRTLSR